MYLVEFYYKLSTIKEWLKDKEDQRFYKSFKSVIECLAIDEDEITMDEITPWSEYASEGYKVTRIVFDD